MFKLLIRIIEDFIPSNLYIKVLKSILLLHFLYLTSKEQSLVVKVEHLGYLDYHVSQRFIKHLLIGSDKTIDNFLMFKAEPDENL